MPVALADRGPPGAGRSPRARTRPDDCVPASRTTTSSTTRRAQVYRGSLGEKSRDERRDRGHDRARAARAARRSPTPCTTRPAAARPRTTRTSSPRRPARRWPGRSATCAARWTAATTGRPTTTARRTRPGRRRRTRARSCRPGSRPTRGRTSATLTALDLRDRGVSGRLISVTLIGSDGTKTVSGEVFRSIFNAGRPPADPMLRSTLFDTAPIPYARYPRGACPTSERAAAWAGADGPNPDPLMVAYHDEEWGTPGRRRHRALRAARPRVVPGGPLVVDDPAQARGVPGGVPRLRPARRGRLRRRRPGAAHGRRRDRPQPRQDRRDDRQRRRVPGGRRRGSGRSTRTSRRSCRRRPPGCRRRRAGRASRPRPRSPTRCRRTSSGAGSGSSARRSSTRSCRASGSSTTTLPGCFRYRGPVVTG